MTESIRAWHFTDGNKLRDGRELPPVGEWLTHDGELVMCEAGLHASVRLIDALEYAPGYALHRVSCRGKILYDTDLVCAELRIDWSINAEQMLRAFARWCALQVARHWDVPEVVLRFLITGDEALLAASRAAARAAAWAAAWDAARAAARDAAWAAAWAASRAAAWAASRDAAWAAARDAAWAAARDAAWDAQNKQLEHMVEETREGRTKWVFDRPEAT